MGITASQPAAPPPARQFYNTNAARSIQQTLAAQQATDQQVPNAPSAISTSATSGYEPLATDYNTAAPTLQQPSSNINNNASIPIAGQPHSQFSAAPGPYGYPVAPPLVPVGLSSRQMDELAMRGLLPSHYGYVAALRAVNVPVMPPPSEVTETTKIKMDFSIDKRSIKLYTISAADIEQMTEKSKLSNTSSSSIPAAAASPSTNKNKLIIEFTFSAQCPVLLKLFVSPPIADDVEHVANLAALDRVFPFEAGENQRFSLPMDQSFDLAEFVTVPVFPVGIMIQRAEPIAEGEHKVEFVRTTCEALRQPNGSYSLRVLGQVASVNKKSFQLQELYGMQQDQEQGGDCVICLSMQRDTTIFPCRHFVICHECAEQLRLKSGKCPICRSHITKLLRLKDVNECDDDDIHQL